MVRLLAVVMCVLLLGRSHAGEDKPRPEKRLPDEPIPFLVELRPAEKRLVPFDLSNSPRMPTKIYRVVKGKEEPVKEEAETVKVDDVEVRRCVWTLPDDWKISITYGQSIPKLEIQAGKASGKSEVEIVIPSGPTSHSAMDL